jgi:hypothetical protein
MPDRSTTERSLHRALLDRSLAHIVRRLRIGRAMSEAAAAACWIAGALLVYQLALSVIVSTPAVETLRWMLTGGIVVVLAWFGVRLARRVTTGDAAAVADRAADLKDELKSAYWLTRDEHSARTLRAGADDHRRTREFIALLVQRASAGAQRLDAGRVVPGAAPRALMAAFVMGLLAAALAWWSPRWAHPIGTGTERVMQSQQAAKPSVRADQAAEERARRKQAAAVSEQAAANATAGTPRANEVDWASLERAAASLGHSEAANALAAAIRTRDVRRATELLEQMKRDPGAPPLVDRAFAGVARPMRERAGQADAGTGRDLLSALGDMFRAEINQVGLDADKSAEANLQRAMEAAEQRAKQNNQASPQTKGGNPENANTPGPRTQAGDEGEAHINNAQGDGNNPGGNSQPAEGSGQHVSLSEGADGRNPADVEQSRSLANVVVAPVDGPKTQRLQAQLQRVRIDGQQSGDAANEGAEERLYAATRAQRSSLDYQAVANQPRYTKEEATTGERVPLAQRAVVRDYFLNLRATEKKTEK